MTRVHLPFLGINTLYSALSWSRQRQRSQQLPMSRLKYGDTHPRLIELGAYAESGRDMYSFPRPAAAREGCSEENIKDFDAHRRETPPTTLTSSR